MRIMASSLSGFPKVSPQFRLNDAQRFVEQIIIIININGEM